MGDGAKRKCPNCIHGIQECKIANYWQCDVCDVDPPENSIDDDFDIDFSIITLDEEENLVIESSTPERADDTLPFPLPGDFI